jgi:hypothetical protein
MTNDDGAKYWHSGGLVIRHAGNEEMLMPALVSPLPMIASNGILKGGVGHPRAAGTYARVLGRYVR